MCVYVYVCVCVCVCLAANRQVFTVKDKKEKALAVADSVVGRAAKYGERTAGETRTKVTIQSIRKTHWWEKFNWFISSDGHIVIAGRDAQQNEMLVKRYMRKGDAYVHAEVHGAASCVVKSKVSFMFVVSVVCVVR